MLKKVLLVIGILLIGFFVYVGILWAKDVWPIKDTILKNDGIGKLSIGMDESHIRHYYPDFFIAQEGKNNVYYYNDKNSFVVTAENKKVVCIELVNEVPNQNFSTEKNIKLGSTFKEVTAAYGENYRTKSTERYGDVLEYQDSNTNQKLVIGLFNDKVSLMIFYNYEKFDYPF
ncbi:hypothetical protein [Listeria grandensis]|uniref:hypothetical protein n=1 Tax=Listeria grandensis TaxID=1494963 RepID=UPI00164E4311|nr:hypothetical protein [Listeria grandensis]MBC6315678.1 hypothetical protein [Listeria grandensis]